jgi:4,5-DOPA dioxygenase extradiol
MPALFVGHGNPMNAIEENQFVQGFRDLGATLPKPSMILCISAHWETRGTKVTAAPNPKTIHDFGGFPPALFAQQYPAPGHVDFAKSLALDLPGLVQEDHEWGLDHGAWTVLKHLYPKADVPVVELSLDRSKDPAAHYELGRMLQQLRYRGVLIVGSGNIVHNLRAVSWQHIQEVGYGYDWAAEARAKLNGFILKGDHSSLKKYASLGAEVAMSIPTPEHYLPLLYTLAAQDAKDEITLFNDHLLAGSLSMTSVLLS